MKPVLPSSRNPFMDYVLRGVGHNLVVISAMREAKWDEDSDSVAIMFVPDVEADVDALKEEIVTRFREMANPDDDEEETEDKMRHEDFPFTVAAQQLKINDRTNLLVRVYHSKKTGGGRSEG